MRFPQRKIIEHKRFKPKNIETKLLNGKARATGTGSPDSCIQLSLPSW
jgi:hypothetical protein